MKKYSYFFLVGLILILAGCSLTSNIDQVMNRMLLNNEQIQTQLTPTTAADEVVNWKTLSFFNDKYSFKYPANWYLDEEFQANKNGMNYERVVVAAYPPPYDGPGGCSHTGINVALGLSPKNRNFSELQGTVADWIPSKTAKLSYKSELLNIDGRKVIKLDLPAGSTNYNRDESITYYFLDDEITSLTFRYCHDIGGNNPGYSFNQTDIATINSIVNSFKSIKP